MQKTICTILYLCLSWAIFAQTIPFHDAQIEADGKLEEAIWKNIPPFEGFHNFFPINDGAAQFDTEVRIYQDGKYLNVSFIYHDSLASIRVNSLKRDNYGAGYHLSDCVGIIIDPYNNQHRGYFFALNGEGAQLDALVANYDEMNLSWDAIWESGTTVQGTDKIYEFKIPLSTFSYEEAVSEWSFQFYTRDAKDRMYTVWNKFERGFLQFDTRFLRPLPIENLQPSKIARTTLIPAITTAYQQNLKANSNETTFQPSLDAQYKISDGLRIDATINPDFSQVDVDQQVTNLTRFNIIFPERRNFFIENSDMFTTLGASETIIPFFSRFIGASQDIMMGIKLSGNVSKNTRIGLLNVQSKKDDSPTNQNYTIAVAKHQFTPIFNATTYIVNRQTTDNFEIKNDYNRVAGLKANYLSKNRKWSGFGTYSHSFNDRINGESSVFSIENNYNTRTLSFSTRLSTVGKNYHTDIGFVPRLNNYDALNDLIVREGYTQLSQSLLYNYFPKDQSVIQSFRPIRLNMDVYFDKSGYLFETNYFYNTALFFANQMSTYINVYHNDIDLKYAFDPLRNGNFVLPDHYQNTAVRIGFNSDYTRNFYGSVNIQYGSFYEGQRYRLATDGGYRFLPFLSLSFNYEYNFLSFNEIGNQHLHLIGLTTELFFNNKLNWTTYFQYNQQINNFNVNSRLQWEYKPLSFIYLVFADNYSEDFMHKNWGVSLKVIRRLNF